MKPNKKQYASSASNQRKRLKINGSLKKAPQLKDHQTIVLLFNKPYNTLCQFSGEPQNATLARYIPIKSVYPVGRLDKDSEGLLLLTNDGQLQHEIAHPKAKVSKTYWVQVEGLVSNKALEQLQQGVVLKDGLTRPAQVSRLDINQQSLKIAPRVPPIRQRKNIPTCWIAISIREGKNRQIRRMTAAVGHPTLRLIRVSIGPWRLDQLQPGEYKQIKPNLEYLLD